MELLPFIFGGPKNTHTKMKKRRKFSLTGKRPTMYIQVVAGKPGWRGGESSAQG